MQDFKLEYTEPDKVYDTVDPIKDETPQYRYYEIEVESINEQSEDEAKQYDIFEAN